MIAVMGQMSCYSGEEIRWDQINESNFRWGPDPKDCTWDMQPPTRPDSHGVYPVCAIPGVTRTI